MNKYPLFVFLIVSLFFFSCKSQPKPIPVQGTTAAAIPVTPAPGKIQTPDLIMGKGSVPQERLSYFLLQNNRNLDRSYAQTLSGLYIEEALSEGINHDVAFAQMCLETGYLKFGGLVQREWNNFCGLGAIGPEQPGLIFPDARTGVRAHIQHLKAYATAEPLKQELVDPRYKYVRLGSSPVIDGLAGTWAADKMYAVKIKDILERLYNL
jgi:hypothetical protein